MVVRVLIIIVFFFFGFGIATFISYVIDGKLNKETFSLSSIQSLTKERYERNIEEAIATTTRFIRYTAEHGRNSVVISHILLRFNKEDREIILNYFKNKGFKIEEEEKKFGSECSVWYNISW